MAKCLPIVHTATMHQCRNCFVRQPHAQRATAKKKGNGRLVNQPNFRQTKALVFIYFPTEIEANYILFWTSSQLLPLSFLFIYFFIFLNNKKKLEGGRSYDVRHFLPLARKIGRDTRLLLSPTMSSQHCLPVPCVCDFSRPPPLHFGGHFPF